MHACHAEAVGGLRVCHVLITADVGVVRRSGVVMMIDEDHNTIQYISPVFAALLCSPFFVIEIERTGDAGAPF